MAEGDPIVTLEFIGHGASEFYVDNIQVTGAVPSPSTAP